MYKRNPELFLFDILVAILKIKEIVKDIHTAESLQRDFIKWDAVIREFEIIGEAVNKLMKIGTLGEEKREIVDFRNILIHEYFGVDPEIVWSVIKKDLDNLFEDIVDVLKISDRKTVLELIDFIEKENEYLDFIIEFLVDFRKSL
ncbi:MAG: HepT-like ribonuclease domain-containing protein [Hydrogenothermaceae bacterium]